MIGFIVLFFIGVLIYAYYWVKRGPWAVFKFDIKGLLPAVAFLSCILMPEYKYKYNPEVNYIPSLFSIVYLKGVILWSIIAQCKYFLLHKMQEVVVIGIWQG